LCVAEQTGPVNDERLARGVATGIFGKGGRKPVPKSEPMVSLAFTCKPPLEFTTIVPASAMAAPPESTRVPAVMLVEPEYVLMPESVRVPASSESPPEPLMALEIGAP